MSSSVAPLSAQTLSLLNVPYLTQSEALCGGAAAAMVLRFWGAQDLTAESFSGLVDRSAAGIRTDALRNDLVSRGWEAVATEGDGNAIVRELERGRPAVALIEDRPGTYHYVVVVGWHARGVVLHDPARTPYRVMTVEEFGRRWRATRQWTLAVAPRESASRQPSETPGRLSPAGDSLSCEGLIARGVSEAEAGDLNQAERTLTSALSCPGSAARRELAGVRALQRRWPEVVELASTVVAEAPGDTYAWQLLATARFVSDDPRAALTAWNAADAPRLDLLQVEGLRRTRQRVVETLAGLQRTELITPGALRQVERQLADWPALTASAVTYVPRPNGIADVRIRLTERDLLPRRLLPLGLVAGRALITRELRVPFGPMTGGGDRLELTWRFWPDRPRYSANLTAPAPWGGLWGVQVSSERQPLTAPAIETFRHDSAGLVLSAWHTGMLRWQAGGGIDRWADRGRFPTIQAALDLATTTDALRMRVRGQTWLGSDGFGTMDASVRATHSIRRSSYVVDLRAGVSRISASAPFDIWPAGDTGHARPTLLRAHPLLTRGRYRTTRLGADVMTMSTELQRLWRVRGIQVSPTVFADVGRTARRLEGGPLADADLGVGVRLRVPGLTGTVRVDAAKGLRDGARALSFVYEP